MTSGKNTGRAELSSSGWALPAGSSLKQRPEKWLLWLLPLCYAALRIAIDWISDEYVQTSPADTGLPQIPAFGGIFLLILYALVPLYVFAKIGFTTVCLALGAAIITWKVRFSSLFHAAALAEVVWIAATLSELVWRLFFPGAPAAFYPLSVVNFVEIGESNWWAVYALSPLNLFQVAYVAALAYAIRLVADNPPPNVTLLAAVSYGGGKALLVAGITFFMLYMF